MYSPTCAIHALFCMSRMFSRAFTMFSAMFVPVSLNGFYTVPCFFICEPHKRYQRIMNDGIKEFRSHCYSWNKCKLSLSGKIILTFAHCHLKPFASTQIEKQIFLSASVLLGNNTCLFLYFYMLNVSVTEMIVYQQWKLWSRMIFFVVDIFIFSWHF